MAGTDEAPELRVDDLFAALLRRGVRFLVVGGVGCQLQGATRVTRDLDICPSTERDNIDRLAQALMDLDARLRLTPELGDVLVAPDAALLREFPITRWRTRAGDVDVLLVISGDADTRVGFQELEPRAVIVHVADAAIPVAALQDIVRSKEHADREKDRQALPELRALLAARGDDPTGPPSQAPDTGDPPRRTGARCRLEAGHHRRCRGPTLGQ